MYVAIEGDELNGLTLFCSNMYLKICHPFIQCSNLLSGEPDYFGRNKISSGGDLSHYSSASLY